MTRGYAGMSLAIIVGVPTLAFAQGGVLQYGDADVLGTGFTYGSDPRTGASLQGLAPGAVTFGSLVTSHTAPPVPTPSAGDYPGTDQVYAGSTQTAFHDLYSTVGTRIAGPQFFALDYSSLMGGGTT